VQTHPLVTGTSTTPSYVPAKNFSLALVETLRDGSKAPLFSQAERTISALPPGDLRKTLLAFVESAGGDLDAFRTQVEQWFDHEMDRVAGAYKRVSQYMMLFLGLLIAVALNVDSVRVASTLWQTPDLRNTLAQSAAQAVQKQPAATGTDISHTLGQVKSYYDQVAATNVPLGWTKGTRTVTPATIGGWVITALAIGLGAPFWFALLQSLVNMRSAGPAPKSSNDNDGAKK
jgi:hypothetical protein